MTKYSLIILLFLASCTTQHKAYTWMDNHTDKAAEYSLSRFPTNTNTELIRGEIITIIDTLKLSGYDVIKIDCNALKTSENNGQIKIKIPADTFVIKKDVLRVDTVVKTIERKEWEILANERQNKIIDLQKELSKVKEDKKKLKRENIIFKLIFAGMIFAGGYWIIKK